MEMKATYTANSIKYIQINYKMICEEIKLEFDSCQWHFILLRHGALLLH